MIFECDTRVTRTIDIEAPVEKVWKILTDFAKFLEIDPVFKKIRFLTNEREGIGTMTQWDFTTVNDELVSRFEIVTEYKTHEYYTYRVLSGAPPKDCTLIFLPIKNGTRVIFTEYLRYPNPDVDAVGQGMEIQLKGVLRKALAK